MEDRDLRSSILHLRPAPGLNVVNDLNLLERLERFESARVAISAASLRRARRRRFIDQFFHLLDIYRFGKIGIEAGLLRPQIFLWTVAR